MSELVGLGSTFVGASVVAFVALAAIGVIVFIVASTIWRDEAAYWEDVAGMSFLGAATSFSSLIVFAIIAWCGHAVTVPHCKSTIAAISILAVAGIAAADRYFRRGPYTKQTAAKWLCLGSAGLTLGFAGVLTVGLLCGLIAGRA